MSYEPKIEVVRAVPNVEGLWTSYALDDFPNYERAYVVRGVPAPGDEVRGAFGRVRIVTGLELDGDRIVVRYPNGGRDWLSDVRPYDPEAERLRVATEAITKYWGSSFGAKLVARAVLDALKEVDDEG